jgi:hypothetical protein
MKTSTTTAVDIARLKKRVYDTQMSFWVEADLKKRLKALKDNFQVDTIEEIRKAVRERVSFLESMFL